MGGASAKGENFLQNDFFYFAVSTVSALVFGQCIFLRNE